MMTPIRILFSAAFASLVAFPTRASDAAPSSPIKRLPLTSDGSVYLSLGGEIRERFEYYSEPFFGLRGVAEDDYLLHRLLLSADLHLGNQWRIFLELGNHLEVGKVAGRAPTDVDEFDVQQGFVDFTIPLDTRGSLRFRAGRQEMTYGSGRLVSVREGANIRRSFDGGRLTFTAGEATFDAFGMRTVNLKVGALNDDPNRQEAFWGIYGVVPVHALPDGHADIYYLGLERDDAIFQQGVANEHRDTFGIRLWGSPGSWDYNYEAVIQTGSFGNADIVAWTVATETGYTFRSLPFRPRIGVKADIASGDGNPNDNRLTTFNALFPKQPYFSEASLIAPANLIDLHPSLALEFAENLSFAVDVDWFWKQRTGDAIYAPPGRPLFGTEQGASRYIGSQINTELEWRLSRNVSMTFYYSHFFAGTAVTDAGGHDVDFVGSWISVKF